MTYKHATIIPLIGGMPIAQQLTFNKPPEFVLSYSAFGANDSHYIHWLNEINKYNVPYIVLDEENINPHLNKHVDVICATPPCAGLSSLSVSSSAENKTNDWMYISTKQILEEYRPKVFWGENAPRLFTAKGKPVADELIKIGKENGYSFMMYGTQSRLHGNPQIRPRTFFFFFEGDQVPIFPFIRKEQEMVESILSKGIS
jgi:site-specific DNA-cytosine methylase